MKQLGALMQHLIRDNAKLASSCIRQEDMILQQNFSAISVSGNAPIALSGALLMLTYC
jgi:hypothetical protein